MADTGNYEYLRLYPKLPDWADRVLRHAFKPNALDQTTPVEVLRHAARATQEQVDQLCDAHLLQRMNDGCRITPLALVYFPEARRVLGQLDLLVRHAHRLYEPGVPPVRLEQLGEAALMPDAFDPAQAQYLAYDLRVDLRHHKDHFLLQPSSSNAEITSIEDAFHVVYGTRLARLDINDDGPSVGAFGLRIKTMRAVRFRSLQDNKLVLQPDGLTVLVGPNATGKSTLLDSIAFIANAGRAGLARAIDAEGGVERLRTRGRKGAIELEVEFTADLGDGVFRGGRYRIAFDDLGRPALDAGYIVEDELLALQSEQGEQALLHGTRGIVKVLHTNNTITEAFRNPGELTLPSARGTGLLTELRRDLGSVALLDRDPLITMTQDNDGPRWMTRGATGRRRLVMSSHKVLRSVANEAERVEQLSQALRELVPNVTSVRQVGTLGQDCQLEIHERDTDGASTWEEISAGTRQMLLLCALYVHPNPPRVILLEEPDAALHAGTLPVLRDLLRSIARRSVVVATTHSPAFVNLLDPEREVVAVSRDRAGTHVQSLKEALAEKQWLDAFGSTGEAFLRMAAERQP